MPKRLSSDPTPATREEVFNALYMAWLDRFEAPPSRDSVILLLSHWALETGWGQSMRANNIGNIKSREGDGKHYCFFTCGEEVYFSVARAWESAAPDKVAIVRTYPLKRWDGKIITMASVMISPDHPACRFRAYETLEEGAADYLQLLHVRFSEAWPSVQAGDPEAFVHALKQQGYFTASESTYVKGVKTIFDALRRGLDVDVAALPVLSEAEKFEAMNLVAATMRGMDLGLYDHPHADDEKD